MAADTPSTTGAQKEIALALAAGLGLFCALLLAIIISNSTFEQRCAAVYQRHIAAQAQETDR